MHLQASFLQLFALGLLIASTVAVGQKVFELYHEEVNQKNKVQIKLCISLLIVKRLKI